MAGTAEVARVAPTTQAPSPTPMQLLDRALASGVEMDKLEKLLELQERWEKNQARKAFDAAVASAKSEIPVVKKNRLGHNNKRYADLAAFASAVDPVLAKHKLSYRYRSRQEGGAIYVTCILAHQEGHSEETTLSAPADNTGNKNSIQAIGSTLTYMQRYTLSLALGLASSEDDDGQAAGGDEPITGDQLKELLALKDKSGSDLEKLCAYFKIEALPDLRQSQFQNAKAALQAKAAQKAKATKGDAK